MLTLCGIPLSNYHNKVKMVLLEKGIPFEEQRVPTGSTDEAVLACSPLAKVPFLRTEHGSLCESQVIVDYLEAAYPEPPLLPAEPFAAAKVRELAAFVDLHLELVARELYAQAFFGGRVGDEVQQSVRKRLVRHVAGFRRLARFSPYVAGERFTQADCAAFVSLPLVGMATRIVLGEDLLAAGGIDWKTYVARVGERPSAQKVSADRKADEAAMAAARAKR
ncbi:MAG TPA: glutathione S-transferase [Rubrivivax sp.]|mgnify:CR=1 FL=1|jgi:glutathione S-transferase|nr:glutathione S-transferase [Rhodoferax sp.]MCL4737683.1 glutathione S-transferase family protein [Burkholderiaceae bacterium]MCP5288207.1 glutathione S-transferase [Burkholderiaceae bacterium]HMQ70988.1 glutathione S-transferase [Rubrivivax sp.]HMR69802.1 glutathione S-transferase [Rubrivivax sp.]